MRKRATLSDLDDAGASEVAFAAASATTRDRFSDLDAAKLRGGYYTPHDITVWLCRWAVRRAGDAVLEPSCGDGVFVVAAGQRLAALGALPDDVAAQLTAIEINAGEAAKARAALRLLLGSTAASDSQAGATATGGVHVTDFFAWHDANADQRFDAVVGNPPFIRYQSFPEPHRARAMQLMVEAGLTPNKLTNIWVPFVVGACSMLRPGGRLALVLPAELLQVTYAAQLRAFLTDRFARIDIVACNEMLFDRVEQEVVLLLADGAQAQRPESQPCRIALTEAPSVSDVVATEPAVLLAAAAAKTGLHDGEKWLKYFLSSTEIGFMRALRESRVVTPLATHARVDVGVVTGNNAFFVLTAAQVDALGIGEYMVPLVSRAAQLRGACLSATDWQALADDDGRVHLLHLRPQRGMTLSPELLRYIQDGETRRVNSGYKCSMRKPWYDIPAVWIPDGFLFRQIYDFPKVVLNQAGATATDTIHRFRTNGAEPQQIIAHTYSWLTAASAEIEGRSYGGGVLELEPSEAERLLMPVTLDGAMPLAECDRLVREGRHDSVFEENARTVLRDGLGLSRGDCAMLREIWTRMRARRLARGRSVGRAVSSPT